MKKTQSLLLHQSGVQLLQKAADTDSVDEIETLTNLALKLMAEARDITSGGVHSVWSFIDHIVNNSESNRVRRKKLFGMYKQFCVDNSLSPEEYEDFIVKISGLFRLEGDVVLIK